ncbi:Uncharacterised protein [Mycoplasmopsis maculosa]|uniref:Uncharacterized protein n=1 Tax=Mycoplasmopsis maculosa TaxID=114885 RepID=A0A449B5I5_9BACT|nr:Uncharacterised protein [Mycoplasmopsis maculosa]
MFSEILSSASFILWFKSDLVSLTPSSSTLKLWYCSPKNLILSTNKPISIPFNSSDLAINNFAFSACFLKGINFLSISEITNLIFSRPSSVLSNLVCASFFLNLYFDTPAASSKISFLSSTVASAISLTVPWLIIAKLLLPIPDSMANSLISL